MAGSSFRFSPPDLPIPPAAAWALAAAFGPAPGALPVPADSAGTAAWAWRLGLAPRLADRLGEPALADRFAGDEAARLTRSWRRAAAGAVMVGELARIVGGAAASHGLAVALLKGAALVECGFTAAGSRGMADLDVLCPPERAPDLDRALGSLGFRASTSDESRMHLPPRIHPELGMVEVHTLVVGVRVGGADATLPALLEAEQLRPVDRLPAVLAPKVPVLAAHAIAHAVAQHGLSPAAYPFLRLVGDLDDLAAGGDRAALSSAAAAWLDPAVAGRELRAVAELTASLTGGELPPAGSDALALLRHALAGATDQRYRRRLKLRAALAALRRRDWRKLRGAWSRPRVTVDFDRSETR